MHPRVHFSIIDQSIGKAPFDLETFLLTSEMHVFPFQLDGATFSYTKIQASACLIDKGQLPILLLRLEMSCKFNLKEYLDLHFKKSVCIYEVCNLPS